ncbi:MAG: response regulator [Lachnospiraceae bacterium]|nr:response regulator [Lachnospiraceae bacterium]
METNKTALIVSEKETFTVRGLEMKLKTIDIEPLYSAAQMEQLKTRCEEADLFILYTDDEVGKYANILVFMRDYCIEHDKQIVVIGAKEEYKFVCGLISENQIHKFYERPLDMERFLDEMSTYFSEVSEEARRKSILIVDDDVSYMRMIADWLKDKYRVSMVNSGLQAITWLARNHADLILLDYEMPVTSGPQVLEMLRTDSETANTPVIFLTGKSDKESIMKVLALKPSGYLLKSIERKDLRDNLARHFTLEAVR